MGASAGRVLLIPKGDWNANTTYTGLDLVRHNGAAWVCKNTCTGIEPTESNEDNWQIMSRDGQSGSVINVDTAMSDTSENPVQNKVIKAYVDEHTPEVADMTGSTSTENGIHGLVPAPQAGDEKKVLLGDGTWWAIDDKFSFSDHDTATSGTSFTDAEDGNMLVTDWTKNLLNPKLATITTNGVTCTNNGDGTYTLNGTASSDTYFFLENITKFEDGKYKIVGFKNPTDHYGVHVNVLRRLDEVTEYSKLQEKYIPTAYLSNDVYKLIQIGISVSSGTTLTNEIVKPMFTTDLSATYDDFVPYGGYEIKTCGKNLLNHTLETTTQNGVTCTNNGDGTYTLNGTATDIFSFDIAIVAKNEFTNKTCLLIDCGKAANSSDGRFGLIAKETTAWTWVSANDSNDYKVILSEYYCTKNVSVRIEGVKGDSYNNAIVKPMLTTDLSATYDDFEPYTGETITVTNTTEAPAFGLKSRKGITNIISPANVKCVYPTNESGKGVLDAMYNNSQLSNELSKLKNAIIAMGGTV